MVNIKRNNPNTQEKKEAGSRVIVVRKPPTPQEEKRTIIIQKKSFPTTSPPKKRIFVNKEKGGNLVEFRPDDGEDYHHLDDIEHIYLLTDMYLGSDQQNERDSWILDLETLTPVNTTVTLPAGVERVFLEILPNAGDNALRSLAAGVDPGIIEVEMDSHWISVKNGGLPIPIRFNKTQGMWNPDMIFGKLHTSSNYDTTKERIGCGRNGYGAKLSNIFSKHFIVEIGDPERGLHYHQEWEDNMRIRHEPIFTKDYTGEVFVKISYYLDFERFGYSSEEGYPEEAFGLFARYVYDYSQTIRTVTRFNQHIFEPSSDPKDHGRFYFGDVPMIIHYEWPTGTEVITKKSGLQVAKDRQVLPTSILILADTPRHGKCVAFVNGMITPEGVHVNAAFKAISGPLLETINNSTNKKTPKKGVSSEDKDEKKIKLTWKDVKNHLSLLLICHLRDPQFGGQTKEKLTKPVPKFKIDAKLLTSICKWSLITYLAQMVDDKVGRLLASTNGKKSRHIDGGKGRDANFAGGPRSSECILFLVEGDSAKQYAYIAQGIVPDGPDLIGVLPLKGKLINVMKALANNPLKILKNKEIKELKKYTGLEDYTDYEDPRNFNRLRYGAVAILADADDDGTHIRALVMNYFHCFAPSLLKLNNYLLLFRTHIVKIPSLKLGFYTEAEFILWKQANPDYARYGPAKYYKGLGSMKKEDVVEDFQNPQYVTCIYDHDSDFTATDALDLAFNDKRADDRKRWLRDWSYTLEELNIGHRVELPISEFIDKELVVYALASLRRAIPSLMDGLKDGQRKILWAAYLIWGKAKNKNVKVKRVAGLGAYVVENLDYHHGEDPLEKTIVGMAQNFVGSNNMNYLYPDGMFGSRVEGGKDASAGRYIHTKLEWWFPYVFKAEDMPLLTLRHEDGRDIEPYYMLPILPMHLINGAHGVGTAHSTHIPKHNPKEISDWFKARLKGNELPKIMPWYRGFTGSISSKVKKGHGRNEFLDEKSKREEGLFTLPTDSPKGQSLITQGRFEHRNGKVIITELPIGVWNLPYQRWLEQLLENKEITDFTWHGDDEKVHFEITGFKGATHESLRLIKSYGMTNMYLLDMQNRPVKYNTIEEILEDFYRHRLPFFEERKKRALDKYKEEITRLDAKKRYIEAIRRQEIDLNSDNHVIETKLQQLGIPNFVRDIKTRALANQNVDKFIEKINAFQQIIEEYSAKRPEDLWYEDLVAFDQAWSSQEKKVIKKAKIVTRSK